MTNYRNYLKRLEQRSQLELAVSRLELARLQAVLEPTASEYTAQRARTDLRRVEYNISYLEAELSRG